MVMLVIGVLIAVFVSQIPAILNWYRVHLSNVYMQQLAFGIDEYHRVYGDYPPETVNWNSTASRLEEGTYLSSQGFWSLPLMLLGPDGAGWGPTADRPGIKEFGPIPNSPGFLAKDVRYERPQFEDPFGRPILYYRAHTDSQYPDINREHFVLSTRYVYLINFKAWEGQRGADELAYGSDIVFQRGAAQHHWERRLTRSTDSAGNHTPYNDKTYVLWLAGSDERFGYWSWSDEHGGFVADPDPEDGGATDGIIGVCDDRLNTGG